MKSQLKIEATVCLRSPSRSWRFLTNQSCSFVSKFLPNLSEIFKNIELQFKIVLHTLHVANEVRKKGRFGKCQTHASIISCV